MLASALLCLRMDTVPDVVFFLLQTIHFLSILFPNFRDRALVCFDLTIMFTKVIFALVIEIYGITKEFSICSSKLFLFESLL